MVILQRKKRIEVLEESISDSSSSEDELPVSKSAKRAKLLPPTLPEENESASPSPVQPTIELSDSSDSSVKSSSSSSAGSSSQKETSKDAEDIMGDESSTSEEEAEEEAAEKPEDKKDQDDGAGLEPLCIRSSMTPNRSGNIVNNSNVAKPSRGEVIEIDLDDDEDDDEVQIVERAHVPLVKKDLEVVEALEDADADEAAFGMAVDTAQAEDEALDAAKDGEMVPLDMYQRTASSLMDAGRPPLSQQPREGLVPLRKRANSDLIREKNSSSDRSGYSKDNDRETPEKWRNRLWPGKAIVAYCRIITRCIPPAGKPGKRLELKSNSLTPHWRNSEIRKIENIFESPTAHSAAFFLLTVEESRAAVTVSDDVDTKAMFDDRGNATVEPVGKNGWLDCEILNIVAESEYGTLPQACDPRLGSVWVISVIIRTPNVSLNEAVTNKPNSGGKQQNPMSGVSKEASLSGGDLMLLHSTQWKSPLLGIVQPWDPDYDFKFGTNFSLNQSNNPALMNFGGDANVDITTANLLVCIDGGDGQDGQSIGGWAPQGAIHSGVVFSMAAVGNVMTYIRECQALMSLRLLSPVLRDTIITNPHGAAHGTVGTASSSSATAISLQHGQRSRTSSDMTTSSVDSSNIPAGVPSKLWRALCKQYNDSQLRAMRSVCRRDLLENTGYASPVCLLQGPPGTGKTKTILGVLSVLLAGALKDARQSTKVIAGASFRHEGGSASEAAGRRSRSDSVSSDNGMRNTDRPRVLVCAPSNTAVDELVFRIITQGILDGDGYKADDLCVVRIGHASKEEYTKRNKSHVFLPSNQRDGKKLNSEDFNVIRVVERVSLDNMVEDRRRALQASDAKKQLGVSFKYADIRKQILERADIVCCTLSGAGSQPILEVILRITGFKFDAVIIDEAAQAVEPSSLIPFKFNPQLVVMVGDPCQLPATVFSKVAKEANYGQSLFYRLQKSGHVVTMLETQYRMHPMIAKYPSYRFYQNKLITADSVINTDSHKRVYHQDKTGKYQPFVFHDLVYSQEEVESTSLINREEAKFVLQLFDDLITRYPAYKKNIGIIAPYRAQRRLLMQLFRQKYAHGPHDLDTEIATVDGFQGREKDIIIFSCVRSHSKARKGSDSAANSIGFLREWQRLNVAITRAKYALWIVGNIQTLQRDFEWQELIKYAGDNDCILHYRALRDVGRSTLPVIAAQNDVDAAGDDDEFDADGKKKKSKKHKKHKGDYKKHEHKKHEHHHHHREKDLPVFPPPAPFLLAPPPPPPPLLSVPAAQSAGKLSLEVPPFSSCEDFQSYISTQPLAPPPTVDRYKQINTTVPFSSGAVVAVKEESSKRRRADSRADSRERHPHRAHHSSSKHHNSSSTASRSRDSRDRREHSRERGSSSSSRHHHNHAERDSRERDVPGPFTTTR